MGSQGHKEIQNKIDFPPVLNTKVRPGKMRTEWIGLDVVVKKSSMTFSSKRMMGGKPNFRELKNKVKHTRINVYFYLFSLLKLH